MWDANHNPADYEENIGRGVPFVSVCAFSLRTWQTIAAVACEVLARRVIHASPLDRITTMMSTRYTHKELDGDDSDKTSALEMAIDSHWLVYNSHSGNVF